MARPRILEIARPSCHLLGVIVLLLAALSTMAAQELPVQDTVRANIADTLKSSPRKQPFMTEIGNFRHPADTTSILHSNQFRHTDAIYLGDLLWKIPGVFISELGGPGQGDQLSFAGVGASGISLLLDGRPLNDPVLGGYNLYDLPLEYVSTLERVDGPRALLFGSPSPGGILNVVSQQYSNIHPMTKLRFFQGPFEHILTDGVFAQNVSRGLNAMVGIQRHVTDGRFTNSAYDSWNIRARFRYDPSEQLSIWFSEVYTKSTIGLNSGVDPITSPSLYNDVTVIVRDQQSYQITGRHDLTLGAVGNLLNDSTSRTNALLYYSALEREYSIGGGAAAPPVFSDMQESSFWGIHLSQNLRWSFATLLVGAELEHRAVEQSHFLPSRTEQYTSIMGGASFDPAAWLRAEFSVRHERLRGVNALSWGSRLESEVAPGATFHVGHGISYRFPTIQELFWSDSILTRANTLVEERHSLTEIGVDVKSETVELSVLGFRRTIANALTFSQIGPLDGARSVKIFNIPSVEIAGATAGLGLEFWYFQIEGNLTYAAYKAQGQSDRFSPRLTSVGELSYRDQLFGGNLDLKIAIRWKTVSEHAGLQFVPRMLITAQQSKIEIPAFTTLDLYVAAKIGNAYLALTWENPLNTNMMTLPYYPLMNRNIKLGVNWEFTD